MTKLSEKSKIKIRRPATKLTTLNVKFFFRNHFFIKFIKKKIVFNNQIRIRYVSIKNI